MGEPDAPLPAPPEQSASRAWRVLRWLPLALVVFTVVAGIGAIAVLDGMPKVAAWYFSQLSFVVVSCLVFAGALGRLLLRKRFDSRLGLTTVAVAGATLLAAVPWTVGLLPIAYPADRTSTTPHLAIRVPLDGPVVVAWGGDSVKTNYHAAVPDQRWAYDLLVEPALTDTPNLDDYGCFGIPVIAPIGGEVVWAVDGHIDQRPGETDSNNPTGNTVALHLAKTDSYLVIAHLQNGSVAVADGDVVEEGQMVGRCGNSGNTSEPHVHIHHQRQLPGADSIGFAEGLPLSFRDNVGGSLPIGGLTTRDGRVVATGDTIEHVAQ